MLVTHGRGYFLTLILGTCILVLGSMCLNCAHDFTLVQPQMNKLRVGKQRLLVAMVFLTTYVVPWNESVTEAMNSPSLKLEQLGWSFWNNCWICSGWSIEGDSGAVKWAQFKPDLWIAPCLPHWIEYRSRCWCHRPKTCDPPELFCWFITY